MASIDMQGLERRAKLKYEVARLRRALWGFAPALLVVAVAALLGKRADMAVGFRPRDVRRRGRPSWYGRDVRRAVLPGLAMGLAPAHVRTVRRHFGYTCTVIAA